MTAKDLKNALLQEAVQGKLVPQIASEGNAKDLLEEIKKEKAKAAGKASSTSFASKTRTKELPSITDDEIPFDIPDNWCWCSLNDIGELNRGRSKHRPRNDKILYENGNIPFIQTGDVANSNGVINSTKTFYNDIGLAQSRLWNKGTVCLTIAANIGDVAILDIDACFPDSVVGFYGNKKITNNKFVMYCLMWYKDLLDKMSHSTAQKNINLEILSKIAFPLPPLAEQKRIVAAIEQFMPIIEEYDKKEAELTVLNADIAKTLKNAILQEAVQGKLAPQIASEGNAKDLLEEIKKEKAKLIKEGKLKKEKPLPEITDDEIPFDIPENWCWYRLGDIIKQFLVPQRDKPKNFSGNIPWCRIEDIEGMYLNGTHSNQYVSLETVKSMNLKVNPIGTVISANSASIGAAAITTVECCTNQTFIGLVCSNALYNYYLYYYLKAITDKLKKMGTGTTISYISQDKYKEMLFPLPPLAEQKRIVAAIEKLLPLCEKIGENID